MTTPKLPRLYGLADLILPAEPIGIITVLNTLNTKPASLDEQIRADLAAYFPGMTRTAGPRFERVRGEDYGPMVIDGVVVESHVVHEIESGAVDVD